MRSLLRAAKQIGMSFEPAEDESLCVGPWVFYAHIEMRSQQAGWAHETREYRQPALEPGDVWYRLVLTVEFHDEDGEQGLNGELSTPWRYTAKDAADEALKLRSMLLGWREYDDARDNYLPHERVAIFDDLIFAALRRFQLVTSKS